MYENLNFGKDFTWGVATAAYQIEGGAVEGGRRPSIWDTFSHTYGKVKNFENGDIACDHFHRVDEDVALLKKLGVKAYRFSISWSRLMYDPYHLNQEGVDFYNHLIDKLLENGIEPFLTMYHWDLPQFIQDKGGWESREIVHFFNIYSSKIVELFGDRVKHMITLNEPSVFLKMGFFDGWKAPGVKYSFDKLAGIIHHILMAHGVAVRNVRQSSYNDIKVGITLAATPIVPSTNKESEKFQSKCSMEWFDTDEHGNFLYSLKLWADPIFTGKYPDNFINKFEKNMQIEDGDMIVINSPIDFLGINNYTSVYCEDIGNGRFSYFPTKSFVSRNSMGWDTIPESLYYITKYAYNMYKTPIYITENGYAGLDCISSDGRVHDPQRIAFIEKYLAGLKKSKDEGADIKGYFYWSFMDNFEWESGYDPRFGLTFIDYANSQNRIPKDSFYWYQGLIKSQS